MMMVYIGTSFGILVVRIQEEIVAYCDEKKRNSNSLIQANYYRYGEIYYSSQQRILYFTKV